MSILLRMLCLSLGLVLLAPAVAEADELTSKKMSFAERKGQLVVTTSFTELFDRKAYQALSSGVPSTVVARIYVYKKGRKLPVSFRALSITVVYDLWDERYVLSIRDGDSKKTLTHESRVETLKDVTQLVRFPVAALSEVDIGPHYFLALVAELNPVEEEVLAEMRRWLTRSTSETRLDSSSSFFGSFVSIFVNPKMAEADRVIRLRSQPFYRVRPRRGEGR